MEFGFKAHPLMIFRFIKPLIFVAVIPLVRALIQYIVSGSVSGLLGIESVLLFLITFVAVAQWRAISVTVFNERITVARGIFLKTKAEIDFKKLSSVSFKENPLDKISGAVTVCIDTEAGRIGHPDFNIKMYARDAVRLARYIYGDGGHTALCASPVKIAAMAATMSSTVTGLIIGVPILNQAAGLFGVALSEFFLVEIKTLGEKILIYFPAVLRTVTLILLGGYLVSALILFVKNLFFKVFVSENRLEVRSGVIVRRRSLFYKSSVNNVCIEQTFLMRIFRRFSMSASVGGYGDERGERAVIAPCGRRGDMRRQFMLFFPFLKSDGVLIKPLRGKKEKQRFFFAPAVSSAAVMAASAVAMILFPLFYRLIFFLAAVAASLICYYCNLCVYNYRFGRIRFGENISARASNGFGIRELYCEKGRVGEIKLIRYPADRRYGTCKVKITVRSESADSVRVRNVGFERTKKSLLEMTGKPSE